MRISDWSSDVCSSDLPGRLHVGDHRALGARDGREQLALPGDLFTQQGGLDLDRSPTEVRPVHIADLGTDRDATLGCSGTDDAHDLGRAGMARSEEHTSELQSLMRISYAVFCLKKKNTT